RVSLGGAEISPTLAVDVPHAVQARAEGAEDGADLAAQALDLLVAAVGIERFRALHEDIDLLVALAVAGQEHRRPAQAAEFEKRLFVGAAAARTREHGIEAGEAAADFLQVGWRHGCTWFTEYRG